MINSALARNSEQLRERGYVVIDGVTPAAVARARRDVLANAARLRNTRPNPASGHLAGFHRYPELEPLHALVSSNRPALETLLQATGCSQMRSIGLSDITVNRSQPWHVDLLRGKYRSHLSPDICWGEDGGGVYKVLLYLQPGASLKVVPGSHRQAIALDDDQRSAPESEADVLPIDVKAGQIVLMDIRLRHCGSTEEELRDEGLAYEPKILISTVLAGVGKPLGAAMERGNLERLLDWDAAHGGSGSPRLALPDAVIGAAA